MTVQPDPATLLLPFRETRPTGEPSLRIGVVTDRAEPAGWVDALLLFLRQIPGIEPRLFAIAPFSRRVTSPAWLTERLYSASRARFDPFGALVTDQDDSVPLELLDAVRAASCDALVWLARCRDPKIDVQMLASRGVFTVQFGARDRGIPFWDEVASGRDSSDTTLFWHDRSFSHGRAIRVAETATCQGLFVTENSEQPLSATIRMLAVSCLEIQKDSERFLERSRRVETQPLGTSGPIACPSNLEAARFVVKKVARSIHLRYTTKGKQYRWFVAIRPNAGKSIVDPSTLDLAGFQEVPLPNGIAQMADPFLWGRGGRHHLFFEAVAEGQSRGQLARVEILPGGSYSDMQIILDQPYHLSYPCILSQGDDVFLLPETSEAARIDIYRFSRFPGELELVSSPIQGVPLVDTTPIFIDNRWYFFTTTVEPFMESLLFFADRLEGPWQLHPRSPISSSVRSCRSAGNLFMKGSRLFRPTQDCSLGYGHAMTINEVTRLTPQEFAERPVSHIAPSWRPNLFATHTWNETSAFQVIDGVRA